MEDERAGAGAVAHGGLHVPLSSGRRGLVAVMGVASLVVAAYELGLTRLASALFFQDLTCLFIALCLLGLGLGGLWSRRLPAEPRVVAMLVLGLGASLPAVWWGLCAADIAWAVGLFAWPFAGFGAAVAVAYRCLPAGRWRARLYAAETLSSVAGLLLLGPAVLPRLDLPVLGDVGVLTHLRRTVEREGLREHRHATTAYARTDLVLTQRRDVAYVFTDGMFVARAVAWDGRSPRFDSAAVERLAGLKRLPYAAAPRGDILLLGGGAGFDVAVALQEGARRVVCVELNPDTIAFGRSLDAWAGRVFARAEVEVRVGEARRFVRRTHGRYDQINLTLVQTGPAGPRGPSHVAARALTVEALRLYLRHLRPRGVLAITQNTPALIGRTLAGLRAAMGDGADPRVVGLQLAPEVREGNPFSQLLLARNEPWTPAERRRLLARARRIGARPLPPPSVVSPATDDRPLLFGADGPLPVHVPAGGALGIFALLAVLWRARRRGEPVRQGLGIAAAGGGVMAVQVLAVYRAQAAIGNPALAMGVALAAVLGGAGLGALILGPLTGGSWTRSGLSAAFGAAALTACGPVLSDLLGGVSQPAAAWAIGACVAVCALPLGLPFLAALHTRQGVRGASEAHVVGCDGIGAVLGAVGATAMTWALGYTALGLASALAIALFSLCGPGRDR